VNNSEAFDAWASIRNAKVVSLFKACLQALQSRSLIAVPGRLTLMGTVDERN
jgi:hypothetical protein